jgi:hypothetical protein
MREKRILFVLLLSLIFSMGYVSLYAQDTVPDGLNFIGEHGTNSKNIDRKNATQEKENSSYNILVLVIFGVLIFAVLKIFSKLKIPPIITAFATNVLTALSSLIQFKQFFEIITAGLTGLILLGIYAANSGGGGYKHSKKGGGRDNRYKNNPFISISADDVVKHCIFSFVLLLIIGIVYIKFFDGGVYRQFFGGK